MPLFGSNGHAARAEERLASIMKSVERLAAEHTRRADHNTGDLKAMETGLRADLQGMAGTLTRIEGLLKARNGNGAKAAAITKRATPPLAYGTGGGVLLAIAQHFGLI